MASRRREQKRCNNSGEYSVIKVREVVNKFVCAPALVTNCTCIHQGMFSDSKASLSESLELFHRLNQKDFDVQNGIAMSLHEIGLLELKQHKLVDGCDVSIQNKKSVMLPLQRPCTR